MRISDRKRRWVVEQTPVDDGRSPLPPVHRLTVFFEGCGGAGQITGSDLFTSDGNGGEDQILDSDPVEALLETRIPAGDRESKDGGARIAIGLLLDGAILTLLDAVVSRNSITAESADTQCVGMSVLGPVSGRA